MVNELIVYIFYCTGFITLLLAFVAIMENKKAIKVKKARRTYKRTYTNTSKKAA